MSDEKTKWIKQIQEGNERAFEEMYHAYFSRLHRFSYSLLNVSHVAEEVVQEVFANIWENRKEWEPRGTVKAYLFKAVRNRSIDYLRHQNVKRHWRKERLEKKPETQKSTKENLNQEKKIKQIKLAIEEMPERRREVFVLSRFEGMTYKEIAEILDISVSTVETQMVRAFKFLRERVSLILIPAGIESANQIFSLYL